MCNLNFVTLLFFIYRTTCHRSAQASHHSHRPGFPHSRPRRSATSCPDRRSANKTGDSAQTFLPSSFQPRSPTPRPCTFSRSAIVETSPPSSRRMWQFPAPTSPEGRPPPRTTSRRLLFRLTVRAPRRQSRQRSSAAGRSPCCRWPSEFCATPCTFVSY